MPPGFAIVLPARYQSTRFPGKPLALIAGKPLIEWVYRRAQEVRGATRVVVATDHDAIARVVRTFGGEVVMTSAGCRSGTDRVAEAARTLGCDPVVNLQGDEPVFPPGLIEEMVTAIMGSPRIDIVTGCHPIFDEEEMRDPHSVKVVVDNEGRALYFSRAPVPHRIRASETTEPEGPQPERPPLGHRHIGIYVFRAASLFRFAKLPKSRLEILEGLEQLRALEHGMMIRVVETSQPTVGVDVPADVKKIEKALGGA